MISSKININLVQQIHFSFEKYVHAHTIDVAKYIALMKKTHFLLIITWKSCYCNNALAVTENRRSIKFGKKVFISFLFHLKMTTVTSKNPEIGYFISFLVSYRSNNTYLLFLGSFHAINVFIFLIFDKNQFLCFFLKKIVVVISLCGNRDFM